MARDVSLVVRHHPGARTFQTDPDQTDAYLTTKANSNAISVALVGLVIEFGCRLNVEEVSSP